MESNKGFIKEIRGVVIHDSVGEIEECDDIVFSLSTDDENDTQLTLASPLDEIAITIFLNDDIKEALRKGVKDDG